MLQDQAYNDIYQLHNRNVYQLALSYLQNIEDAEEVTQDVFVSLHQNYAQFEERSTLKTYIYRITVNKSLDFIKAKKRKKRFAVITSIFNDDQSVKHEKADFHHPGVVMENKENAAILFKAIGQLAENQRTVFLLSQTEGLGNKEIAVVIEKSVGAVESLLQRAKENLRKELQVYYNNYRRN